MKPHSAFTGLITLAFLAVSASMLLFTVPRTSSTMAFSLPAVSVFALVSIRAQMLGAPDRFGMFFVRLQLASLSDTITVYVQPLVVECPIEHEYLVTEFRSPDFFTLLPTTITACVSPAPFLTRNIFSHTKRVFICYYECRTSNTRQLHARPQSKPPRCALGICRRHYCPWLLEDKVSWLDRQTLWI